MMVQSDPDAKTALFIGADLLFAGKMQSAAQSLGMRSRQASDLPAIRQALVEDRVVILFFDLNLASPTVREVMEALPENPRPITVAFGPHVDTARLDEARIAGCDRVLPRSRFAIELPELLARALYAD